MFVQEDRYSFVTAVSVVNNRRWFNIIPGTFKRKPGDTWDANISEWVPVYEFHYRVGDTFRLMTISAHQITAVQFYVDEVDAR